jgi:protein SCO1/2
MTRHLGPVLAVALLAPAGAGTAQSVASFHGIVSDGRTRAADFTLVAHTGKPASLADYRGQVRLLYFGYTHCPGICPTTLGEIHEALRQLGPERAGRVQVLFVSVDPKRDTSERLAAYLSHFSPSFLGLTGSPEEVARVAAAYGVYVRITEGPTPADYIVDHTSMVIAIDETGIVRVLFPFGTPAPDIAADLRQVLR